MDQQLKGRSLLIFAVLAIVSFSIMFIFQGIGAFDFWWWMSSNIALSLLAASLLYKQYIQEILADLKKKFLLKLLWGILSAAFLYLVFLAGNYFSNLMFSTASTEVSGIYDFKGDASKLRIFLLMLVIIGPGEELFWRGFLQEQLMRRMKPVYGFILATIIYTAVHVLTGNFMLVMAAMVAGIFWGWMYYRFRSITANVISHVVWDIVIFLIIPIG